MKTSSAHHSIVSHCRHLSLALRTLAMSMFKKILESTKPQQSVFSDLEIIFHRFFIYIGFTHMSLRSLCDLRETISTFALLLTTGIETTTLAPWFQVLLWWQNSYFTDLAQHTSHSVSTRMETRTHTPIKHTLWGDTQANTNTHTLGRHIHTLI